MIPRSPSPVQCVRRFGVLVLLAAAAGMTSRRWPFKFFYFFLFFSHPAGAHQWHPNNLYGDAKESRQTLAFSTVRCPAPIVQPGRVSYSSFAFPAGYTRYSDLAGNTNTLTGSTVAIGAKPLLLINQ
jgi:hypothetical protein